jgi:dihydroorotate dehydrogenase (fumarate)
MDLTTKYLGFELKNPLVPSASPLSKSVAQAKELEDHGASAIIMYSLFEEAITTETETMNRFLHQQDTGFAEIGESIIPDWNDFSTGLDNYLENLRQLKEALDIPVIASLNGVTPGGWIEHAKELEQAGADALELNVYYIAADIDQDGQQVEERYLEVLRMLKGQIGIPINMKLSPSFSSVGNMVRRIADAGADGVSLFSPTSIPTACGCSRAYIRRARPKRCWRCGGLRSSTVASMASRSARPAASTPQMTRSSCCSPAPTRCISAARCSRTARRR